MNNDQGHGVDPVADEIQSALDETRLLRLSWDVLSLHLPGDMDTPGIMDVLKTLHDRIEEAERQQMRERGFLGQYVIVAPLNPLNPPSPEGMKKLADALRALDDLGLIVTPMS